MKLSERLAHFVRFTLTGAIGTIAHYAVLVILVELFHIRPLTGSIAGFLTGALTNYTLARLLVFHSDRSHRQALPRFLIVAGIGLMGNALLMSILNTTLGLHYLLAQVLTTGILLLWHYTGNALWTFRQHPPSSRN